MTRFIPWTAWIIVAAWLLPGCSSETQKAKSTKTGQKTAANKNGTDKSGKKTAAKQAAPKPNPLDVGRKKEDKPDKPDPPPEIVPFESEGAKHGFDLEMGEGLVMPFIWLGRGSYTMGNGENGVRPHKEVIDKPFHIGKYEVTQEQYRLVMGNNPSYIKGNKHPVNKLNWSDVQAFVKKMNEKYGKSGKRFALPTEAQWEYACRGGEAGYENHHGKPIDIKAYAFFASNEPSPVGQKKANAWGLHDTLGNVWEWCSDQDVGGVGDKGGSKARSSEMPYVVRGGSYQDGAKSIGIHARTLRRAEVHLRFDGVRLVCLSD